MKERFLFLAEKIAMNENPENSNAYLIELYDVLLGLNANKLSLFLRECEYPLKVISENVSDDEMLMFYYKLSEGIQVDSTDEKMRQKHAILFLLSRFIDNSFEYSLSRLIKLNVFILNGINGRKYWRI
jgi:hypothetical protein